MLGPAGGPAPDLLGGSFRWESFRGVDPATGAQRWGDAQLAYVLTRSATSDLLHNLGVYVGVSFLF